MAYRVIQWATGHVGRAAVEAILAHPQLELVGCWVHSDAKAGRDVGEICGCGPLGVVATQRIEELLGLDADCVVYTPLLGRREEVVHLLRAGLDVVTPLDWFYPFGSAGVAELEAACRRGGSTLHGTGIHPGGITERFPLMASALSRDVRRVRAEEFSDIRSYAAEAVVRDVMLFGSSPQQAARSPMLALLGRGFGQSIQMLAAALGMQLDPELRTTHEMALAAAPIECPIGVLQPGSVAAQRFTWQGCMRGEPVLTARVNWLMGEADLDPPWRFGPEGERFEVEVTGDPSVRLSFHGLHPQDVASGLRRNPGIVATANHVVAAVPYVCEAEPGIRTYLDLPLVAGRAAAALRGETA